MAYKKVDIFEIIFSRSSYRGAFEDVPVPREDLELIVRCGIAAPSGCNCQTPAFVIIDDKAKIEAVKALFPKPSCQSAPAFIMVFTQEILGIDGHLYNTEDYAAAIQNMILAVKALGYETCWYQGSVRTCADDLKSLVNMPENYKFICLLPVGLASDKVIKNTNKKSFNERAWFNNYVAECVFIP